MKNILLILLFLSFHAHAESDREEPHIKKMTGETKGFKIIEFEEGSVYSKLGLRKMDVLKSVDGKQISNPQQAMEIYTSLKKPGIHKVEIERDGKTQTMIYSVK